jgi:hypothetical protein
MPKRELIRGSTSILDVISVKSTANAPLVGLGAVPSPALVAGNLSAQTSGGTLTGTVYIALTYYTTPGANGAANGETLPSTTQSIAASGSTASVIITMPTAPVGAGPVNVYAGTSSGSLFIVPGLTQVANTGSVTLTTMPTSGANPPGSDTSWSNGLAAYLSFDNGTSQTSLPIYKGTLGTWSNAAAPNLTLVALGNGDYQVSYPNATANTTGASSAKLKLTGVTNMATLDWSIDIDNDRTAFVVSSDATPTTSSFTVNTTGSPAIKNTNHFYSTPLQFLVFTSGANAGKCVKLDANGHTVSGLVSTFTFTGDTLLSAPAVGDTGFVIAGG